MNSCFYCHAIWSDGVRITRHAIWNRETQRARLGELKSEIIMNTYLCVSLDPARLPIEHDVKRTSDRVIMLVNYEVTTAWMLVVLVQCTKRTHGQTTLSVDGRSLMTGELFAEIVQVISHFGLSCFYRGWSGNITTVIVDAVSIGRFPERRRRDLALQRTRSFCHSSWSISNNLQIPNAEVSV